MPHKAAAIALRFFDESWTNKGFTSGGLKLWKPVIDRKTKLEKQRPLVKSGNLRQGMDYEIEDNSAIIYNDETYADYHNSGGSTDGRPPQRQFMGDSPELEAEIEEMIVNELNKIL